MNYCKLRGLKRPRDILDPVPTSLPEDTHSPASTAKRGRANVRICFLALPPEVLAAVKTHLGPVSSLRFRSTCRTLRTSRTSAEAEWDLVRGPIGWSLRRGLALCNLTARRLRCSGRPSIASRTWPRVFTTGRQTSIDEPTLKRYVLNAALLRHLTRLGFEVTDNHGCAWDESACTVASTDKKRWAFLRMPPSRVGIDAKAVCLLTYQFMLSGGDYTKVLFAQHKGNNEAAIDKCFDHARDLYQRAVGKAFGARGVPFFYEPYRHGGSCPRMDALNAPKMRNYSFGR